ncbi:MAG: hypothetical protein VCE74_15950, partial [Alphaproteobacteria bacterium]
IWVSPLSFSTLTDLRAVTSTNVTSDDIGNFARKYSDVGTQRRAFVIEKSVIFGLARVYHSNLGDGDIPTQIFQEMNKAREWLGLPPE